MAADITPLERLLLSHIFNAERGGDLYFYADEGPADSDLARLRPDRGGARTIASGRRRHTAATLAAQVPPDIVEIELDFSDRS